MQFPYNSTCCPSVNCYEPTSNPYPYPPVYNLNLNGGLAGEVVFQAAPSVTAFTAQGQVGQLLQSNYTGSPTWITPNDIQVTATGTETSRTLANRFSDPINVKDFGAIGNGIVDDAPAIRRAVNYVASIGGGEVMLGNGRYYIGSSLGIPEGVWLNGEFVPTAKNRIALDSIASALILNSSVHLTFFKASRMSNVLIYNQNLVGVTPFANGLSTTQATIQSTINNYSGVAIYAIGDDVQFEKLEIVGFSKGIILGKNPTDLSDVPQGRARFVDITIDCTNGIECTQVGDFSWFEKINCRGFLGFGYSNNLGQGLDNFVAYRSGIGFYVYNKFDNCFVNNCAVNSYATCFKVGDGLLNHVVASVTFLNCATDASGTNLSNTGFYVFGINYTVKLINCSFVHQQYGVTINDNDLMASNSGMIVITAGHFAGNSTSFNAISSQGVILENNQFQYLSSDQGASVAHVVVSSTNSSNILIADNIFNAGTSYSVNSNQKNYVTYQNNINDGLNINSSGVYGTSGIIENYYLAQGNSTTPTAVAAGNNINQIRASGFDGSNYIPITSFRSGVSGTVSTNNIKGQYTFSTNAGSSNTTDVLVFDSSGNLYPVTTNSQKLGLSSNRWLEIWQQSGAVTGSDERIKTDIIDSNLGLDFIKSLRPVSYRLKVGENKVIRQVYRDADGNEVDQSAEGAIPAEIITEPIVGTRPHFGLIAQEVKYALPDGTDFAGWILTDKNDPTSEQALRYEEFISPIIKAIQELNQKNTELEARIVELESK